MVLDLVNGGDNGCVGEKLFEISLAVLKARILSVELKSENGDRPRRTLQTPTPLVLPVATSFSICFQVSTWL